MRNHIISYGFIFALAIFFAFFGNRSNSKEANPTTEKTTVVDTSGSANPVAVLYQCPMNCEEEKTYSEAVECPKCGMDLMEVDHSGHKH